VTTFHAGARLGPYELLDRLGTGGMGDVWKARDTRLDRLVAIKRLSGAHSDRFEQEARAIAALNHPHICQIHDIGPDFLVLEYVDGTPVTGPLPPEVAIRLAADVAGALEEAHSHGILHRDLKPANVMVTSKGSAKLLDFGLAKLLVDEAEVTRTGDGVIVGTLAYMSPEQADGKPLDVRTDIFSFGALLHEMLSGRRAFSGTTTMQVLNAVLREPPAVLDAPPAIAAIVRRCLEKRPDDRFQSIADVRVALGRAGREIVPRDAVDTRPSIAVLPFANLSDDKENEYFSDGLAEEIINLLAHVPGLTVIARTSAFAFKGKQDDIRRIAEALGVTTVLEGSVRRSGNRIRVTAQLITASNGSHLWSERYDRELTDVFAIQDEIAEAIAVALKVTLALEPLARRGGTTNLAAYEACLRGRYYWGKATGGTGGGIEDATLTPQIAAQRSQECFEAAIRLDPQYALPHCYLGEDFFAFGFVGREPPHQLMPKARVYAERALALDPSLLEAQALLGSIESLYDLEWAAAARRFRLAMAGATVTPHTRVHYGYYLLHTGRLDASREQYERALAEDPLNALCRNHLAWCLMGMREMGESAAQLLKNVEVDRTPWTHLTLALLHTKEGRFAEALNRLDLSQQDLPWFGFTVGLRAGLLDRSGDTAQALSVVASLQPTAAYGAPAGLAVFHLLRGEHDEAIRWFEKTIAQRDTWHPLLLLHVGLLDGMTGRQVMKMLRLPQASS